MRIVIETLDTVREVNRWEIPDATELIGEGAEFCKNLEADTLEREIVAIEPDSPDDAPGADPT